MQPRDKWRIALGINKVTGAVMGASIVSEPNPTTYLGNHVEVSQFGFPTYNDAEDYLRTSGHYSWLKNFCVWKDVGRSGWVRRD